MFLVNLGIVSLVSCFGMALIWISALFVNSMLELTDPERLSTRLFNFVVMLGGIGIISMSAGATYKLIEYLTGWHV